MEKLPDIETITTTTTEFVSEHILSFSGFMQFSILIFAFLLGLAVRARVRGRLNDLIESSTLHWRAKSALTNGTRLIFHFIVFLTTSFAVFIHTNGLLIYETKMLDVVSSLMAAWIFIRIIAQFIANKFIRNIVATIAWIIAALSIIDILSETIAALDALGFQIGEFRLSVLSIMQAIAVLTLLITGSGFLGRWIDKRLQESKDLTPSFRVLLSKIIKVTLLTAAVLIGITSAGIDLSVFAVFGGALGLGIGFGLQKGVSNLFSGMLLLVDKSIKPGDVIELPNMGTFGWVEHMGARYTNIVTRDNKSFLIPNEDFVTQQVVNWSHGNTLVRIETKFGVHYKSDPYHVKKVAEEAASLPERVVEVPSPLCILEEFGDSSINFKLRFWIKDAEKGVSNIKGEVMLALWSALKENNIEIPYPHREVFIHNPDK